MGDVTPDDVLRRRLTDSEWESHLIARAARKAERAKFEAKVERLREALEELDQMHDDCTCRAGKKIIRRALGDG